VTSRAGVPDDEPDHQGDDHERGQRDEQFILVVEQQAKHQATASASDSVCD
jgi:hypothetical protein